MPGAAARCTPSSSFIFLVANIGGSLTPIGDPPLYLALKGVSFFWPTTHLFPLFLVCAVILLD